MILKRSRRAWAALVCLTLGAACGDDGDESFKPRDASAESEATCDSGGCVQKSDACTSSCEDARRDGAGQAGTSSAEGGEDSGTGRGGAAGDGGDASLAGNAGAGAAAGNAGEVADSQAADQAADQVADQATDQVTDQAAEARDTLCEDYCTCMEQTCSTYAGYPFSASGSCLQFCAAWSAAERACFPAWCDEARNGSSITQHLCEHAWGAYGLLEC